MGNPAKGKPRRASRRAHPEELTHRAVADYLRIVAPQNHWWFCHVPNGGARSAAEGGIFKALGVIAGVADILIIPQGGRAHWLEIKSDRGAQSSAQKTFQNVMIALGCPYAVIRSVDEADTVLRRWDLVG